MTVSIKLMIMARQKTKGEILAKVFQLKREDFLYKRIEEMVKEGRSVGVVVLIRKAMDDYADEVDKN